MATKASPSKKGSSTKKGGKLVSTVALFIGVLAVGLYWVGIDSIVNGINLALSGYSGVCDQYPIAKPEGFNDSEFDYFNDPKYLQRSVELLGGAVRIPTETHDDMGPLGEDSRWAVFDEFHKYLKESFPSIYSKFKVETVNTYNLLLTWEGSNKDLKPILYMSHQDVVTVPPDTWTQWTHPPFSGHFDGTFLHGRGSLDCKNNLIGILEALTYLIEELDFKPQRTVLLAFGFDEEISGPYGASQLAPFIEKRYGRDSLALILDEGDGIHELAGTFFAHVATSEKGFANIRLELHTPGGHSSVPPDHTGVGILSEVVTDLENKNLQKPVIDMESPMASHLQCAGKHGKSLSLIVKSILLHLDLKPIKLLLRWKMKELFSLVAYLMTTTQANDVIVGGAKANALPEYSYLYTNYRVANGDTLEALNERYLKIVTGVAKKHGVGLYAFGEQLIAPTKAGYFNVTNLQPQLSPAPVSPKNDVFGKLAGAVRLTFEEFQSYPSIIVTPSLMPANTDTKFYWQLSQNIYRFAAMSGMWETKIHAVDERVEMKEHINFIFFIQTLTRVMDTYTEI
ncbi:hypothetical protein CANCADRAFT_71203 [Tortispora caseinolytica NRRL Y-17796]|uniref:Peptidase M20 dimerisation domain-containing protein n=1 Tax=Tortispora caseinolytica NRRL Y-17796 TaxID=767744 RepID=A0A1E4TIB7_9ASCO|nr:hypothetical protein CANCADRAFT_71203 [Tortispora caseinolytica NRRL Y-17796]